MASLSDLDNLRRDICTADNYVRITLTMTTANNLDTPIS